MNILSINSGSSSKKFTLFDEDLNSKFVLEVKNHKENEFRTVLRQAQDDNRQLPRKAGDASRQAGTQDDIEISQKDFEYAFDYFIEKAIEHKVISSANEIDKIVHRVVHGGEKYDKPVEISEEVIEDIEKYAEFAPLHNPVSLEQIKKIKNQYAEVKQYAVFDTSFHLTSPKENFLYGLPYGYYENLRVRRFGFHGISYDYIYNYLLNQDQRTSKQNTIICHLGSGSSVCAIKNGKAFDNSFGFSPDENLIMATRSGEIDYDAVKFVKEKLQLSDSDVEKLLNKESGLLGISGFSKDMKTLIEKYESDERAKLAVDMYVKHVVDWVSKFYVQLGGIDKLIFTAGIGCGAYFVRELICKKLEVLNIELDFDKNINAGFVKDFIELQKENSKVKIMVIPTNEELQMAKLIKDL